MSSIYFLNIFTGLASFNNKPMNNNTMNNKKTIKRTADSLSLYKYEFNLKHFSEDISNIYSSDYSLYELKVGVTYYVCITDINSTCLGSPVQIPFCLHELTFTNNKQIIALYNVILTRINKYDWQNSEYCYNNRPINSIFDDRSEY